ncbi:MAG TPA: hypothetical protein PK256_16260, partial [Verrucomicrobiota bacterium]|nr:hypothetical protein [Verrucomicrobiota bacterium]
LQGSLHATAWNVASPAPVGAFTTELSRAGSPRFPSRLLLNGFIINYHHRTFTGWTDRVMGCEPINANHGGPNMKILRCWELRWNV